MGEFKHNGYYGFAALMGAAGIALLTRTTAHGFWDANHDASVALLVAAALIFLLTATEHMPGLARAVPRLLRDADFECDWGFDQDALWVDVRNKRAETAFEVRLHQLITIAHSGLPKEWAVRWRNEDASRAVIGAGLQKHLEIASFSFTEFLDAHFKLPDPDEHWHFHQAGGDDIPLQVEPLHNGDYVIMFDLLVYRVRGPAQREFRAQVRYNVNADLNAEEPFPHSFTLRPLIDPEALVRRGWM